MSLDPSPTRRGRAFVALVLLLAGLGVLLWYLTRSTPPDAVAHSGSGAAPHDGHANPFARVTGGAEDPNLDPDELVLSMRGRVIDTEKRPIPDAEVVLLYGPAGRVRSDGKGGSVRSDARGEFVIPQLRAGYYRVEAHKDAAVSATVEVELSPRTGPVTLILVPAAAMIVRVVSARDDHPIAGALVRVAPGNSELGPVEVVREARTDTLGIARIAGLNPVANHGVYAEAPGFASATVNVLAGGNPDRESWSAVLRLPPGGAVTGRVLDSEGQPVAGANLRWYSGDAARDADQAPGLFSSQQGVIRLGIVRSGPDGRFRLGAPAGPGVLEAAHPTHRIGYARGVIPAGGDLTLDVVVENGASLAGVVLDAEGNPVPGADVIATKRGMSHQQMFMDAYRFRATTDRNGEFAFVGLDRDELSLAAWSAEGSSELVDVDLRTTAEQTGIVIELTRTGRISGVVLEGDGQPAPYAQVSFFVFSHTVTPPPGVAPAAYMPALLASPRSQGVVTTGENGRFVITGLVDGEYSLAARRAKATSVAPVFGEARKDQVRPGQDVTLKLPALGSISGRVVADDGGVLTGVTVAAAGWQQDTSYPPGRAIGIDGRFKLPEVPAGRYGIKVSGSNLVDWRSPEAFEVVAGRDTDLGTIRVSRGVPARDGLVIDQAGSPVANAQVLLQLGFAPGARAVDQVSDERGLFEIPAVPFGTVIRVRAYTRDVTSDWQTVGPDVSDIKIVLAAGASGTITGLLVEGGQPLDKRTVMLTLDAGGEAGDPNSQKSRGHTETDAGGSFRFKDVPFGRYRLWVRGGSAGGPEWTAYAEPIVIQSAQEVSVVFQVAQ